MNTLLYLCNDDVQKMVDLDRIIRCVEEAYADYDGTTLSQPRGLSARPSDPKAAHLLVKGAVVCDVIGARFIVYGPNGDGTRLLLLSDRSTGLPLGIVNETASYRLRVGAQAAVAAKYLAPSGAQRLGLIGSGQLARAVVRALAAVLPLTSVRLTSRTPARRAAFAEWIESQLEVPVASVEDPASCSQSVDVLVTATSSNDVLIHDADVGPGTLVMSIGGGQELDPGLIRGVDKVYVDDWEYCGMMGSLAPLITAGSFQRRDLSAHIGEIVAGSKPGRESDHERIIAIPQGLTSADVVVANWLLQEGRRRGMGVELPR